MTLALVETRNEWHSVEEFHLWSFKWNSGQECLVHIKIIFPVCATGMYTQGWLLQLWSHLNFQWLNFGRNFHFSSILKKVLLGKDNTIEKFGPKIAKCVNKIKLSWNYTIWFLWYSDEIVSFFLDGWRLSVPFNSKKENLSSRKLLADQYSVELLWFQKLSIFLIWSKYE